MEKIFIFAFIMFLAFCSSGCRTTKSAVSESVDYIKPETVEAAQYAIDERIASLEREIRESRSLNEAAKAEIIVIRKSCEAIINASRRSGDLIQETLEQAEALYIWG